MNRNRRKILVVEDDDAIRQVVSLLLECEGYAVDSAANGKEALEVLRRDRGYAMILLDLMMPVMNGWEFRTAQQGDPELSRIPVVVLSADSTVAQKAEVLQASGFVRKPPELEDLIGTIARVC